MNGVRCKKCKRLLFQFDGPLTKNSFEIKCPKCKYLNRFWFGSGFDPKGLNPDQEYVLEDLIS